MQQDKALHSQLDHLLLYSVFCFSVASFYLLFHSSLLEDVNVLSPQFRALVSFPSCSFLCYILYFSLFIRSLASLCPFFPPPSVILQPSPLVFQQTLYPKVSNNILQIIKANPSLEASDRHVYISCSVCLQFKRSLAINWWTLTLGSCS